MDGEVVRVDKDGVPIPEPPPKTKDELLAEMKVASDAMDWKAVSKVSSQIAKLVAGEEKAEKDAKLAVVVALADTYKKAIDKVVNKLAETVPADQLEVMQGIWYSFDFEEIESSCRLMKGTTRKAGAGSGGGGGKKFSITTNELLAKHGSEQMGDSGMTFSESYAADTGGNARYKVRMKLLKAEGLS